MKQRMSEELNANPEKYQEAIAIDIETFSESHKIPCFIAIEEGGIYLGSQYCTPDNPPMLFGLNNDNDDDDDIVSYKALELPKGKDMSWLTQELEQSDAVTVYSYDDDPAPQHTMSG